MNPRGIERVVAWMLNRFAERLAERRLVMTTAFGMEGCALIDMIARHGGKLAFETDGVVIKLNDPQMRERLGYTSKFPRWATAFKFPAERKVAICSRAYELLTTRAGFPPEDCWAVCGEPCGTPSEGCTST